LQSLYEALVAAEQKETGGVFQSLRQLFVRPNRECVRGLYFWGGVGRGKTYLMDLFFDSLPFERKLRSHFHRFMQRIHRELKVLSGNENPLELVADRLAKETRVICFDEFFVSDITDAMLLGGLFQALFERGVTLVATSNIVPDGLYKDGLQRERFLPAIALLNKHTKVLNVDGGVDYRLRTLEQAQLYHSPLGEVAEESLKNAFSGLVMNRDHIQHAIELDVEGRFIHVKQMGEGVAWFLFKDLCDGPRSQNDYIELGRIFHTVLLGNVPQMGVGKEDQARRFINLVDEFYDRQVKLVLSAEVPLAELYSGGRLSFEFERTKSRLLEMQSKEYLAREHRG
jgi:cell division protein ZapE